MSEQMPSGTPGPGATGGATAGDAAAGDAAAGGPTPRGGRRVLILAGLTVAVLGLLAMAGWRVVATEARGDVTVTWTGPVECDGTNVVDWRPERGEAAFQTIEMRQGMRCVLPVRVTNGSSLAVDVTRIRLPYMGPGGNAAVQVPQLDGRVALRERAVDAVFAVDERLAPGASRDWEIVFRFRPEGCSTPGSVEWHDGRMPVVRVLALGRPGARSADERIGFRGTRESSCDS